MKSSNQPRTRTTRARTIASTRMATGIRARRIAPTRSMDFFAQNTPNTGQFTCLYGQITRICGEVKSFD
jgi:hypothetical protein